MVVMEDHFSHDWYMQDDFLVVLQATPRMVGNDLIELLVAEL